MEQNVKVIMGLKGTGKTKQMVDIIHNVLKTDSGSIVCIERGPKLTYDVDYRVRLIEASEYLMGSYVFLQGFISGLYAGNYDISNIFIDSLYKIVGSSNAAEVEDFLSWAEQFGKAHNLKFTISISANISEATEKIKSYF